MPDLFKDILPDINFHQKNLIRQGEMEENEFERQSFIINRALSMGADTIFYSNEMNINYNLAPLLKYDYFINSLRKKKRFNKWAKPTKETADLEIVKTYYNYNDQRAREVLDLLDEKQIEEMRLILSKGGTNNDTITRKIE
jgi:hypothetical protein